MCMVCEMMDSPEFEFDGYETWEGYWYTIVHLLSEFRYYRTQPDLVQSA